MKGMTKRAWLAVGSCILVVAAVLSLPALWMVKGQDARIGQVNYLPDYTTIILGEKAASNPVARSLYEHKQSYLAQGEQEWWLDMDLEEASAQMLAKLDPLAEACPTLVKLMEQSQGENDFDPVYFSDVDSYLGTPRIFLTDQYQILGIALDDVTEKLFYFSYDSGLVFNDIVLNAMMEAQTESGQEETWNYQEMVQDLAQEYLTYLGLDSDSFEGLELDQEYLREYYQFYLEFYTQLLYSAEYQVYLWTSIAYEEYGGLQLPRGIIMGVASLSQEELERCFGIIW